MAIWYIDPVSGLDANNGNSWATAFKTLSGATGGKGVVSSDTVRVLKSPDPTSLGQTATWTGGSKTITLTTPITANICLCDSIWTSYATASSSVSLMKQGTYGLTFIAPSSGVVANTRYLSWTYGAPVDFSAYQQISFWFRNSTAMASNTLWRICLCSDTAGATIVNSFAIPAVASTAAWLPITIDYGSALGSSIQSVAIYSGSTPNNLATLSLDNILACKAPSEPDSLTLTSLIGKGGANDTWQCIQSINDATVMIDISTATLSNAGLGYGGVTETVTTYKRETIKTTMVSANSTVVQAPAVSGVTYTGGYDASNVQNGETFFDGQNGLGYAIQLNGTFTLNRLSLCRYYRGYYILGFPNCNLSCNSIICLTSGSAIHFNGSGTGSVFTLTNLNNTVGDGLGCTTFQTNVTFNVTNLYSCSGNAINSWGYGLTFNIANARWNNNAYNTNNTGASNVCNNTVFYGNNRTINNPSFTETASFRNCTFGDTTEAVIGGAGNSRYAFHPYTTPGSYKVLSDNLTIVNDTTTVHTAGGMSWKIAPTSTTRSSTYPADFTVATVFVAANTQVTASVWLRRSNTTMTGQLVVPAGQLSGVSLTASSMSVAANTWEQVQVQFTPTEAGAIKFMVYAWDATNNNTTLWFDDFSVSQV